MALKLGKLEVTSRLVMQVITDITFIAIFWGAMVNMDK
jgi:hypothetical protein